MIPEAYWRFIGRWWWVIALFGAAGGGAGVLWLQNAPVVYVSRAILEINYVRTVEGEIQLDDSSRALEANRIAVELSGSVEMERLWELLIEQGYTGDLGSEGEDTFGGRIHLIPPRISQRVSEPPFVVVVATASTPYVAQWLAGSSAELFAQRINEKYDTELQRQIAYRIDASERATQELKAILVEKRDALVDEEGGIGPQTTQQIIDEHSRILSEIILVLGDLREEASKANIAFNVDVTAFDRTISELNFRVETVGKAWETQLKRPLQILYTLEAQPDYQLALVREGVLQAQYRDHIKRYSELTTGAAGHDVGVSLVTRGSFPDSVPTLGLNRRYLLGFSGMVGIFVGWIIANFAESIWSARRNALSVKRDAKGDRDESREASKV